ncbi:hypothetical protein [Plantactinospora sp. GCM10030261]|uniref:hypothetical protein n=1 Tax=Plantactinospora sp. GCM10030261 TaxID=3273420 RepID=UPI00361F8BA4
MGDQGRDHLVGTVKVPATFHTPYAGEPLQRVFIRVEHEHLGEPDLGGIHVGQLSERFQVHLVTLRPVRATVAYRALT